MMLQYPSRLDAPHLAPVDGGHKTFHSSNQKKKKKRGGGIGGARGHQAAAPRAEIAVWPTTKAVRRPEVKLRVPPMCYQNRLRVMSSFLLKNTR